MAKPHIHQHIQSILAEAKASSKFRSDLSKSWPKTAGNALGLGTTSVLGHTRSSRIKNSAPGLGLDSDPLEIIRDTVASIQQPSIRQFLQSVVQEPEVKFLMCMRRDANTRRQQFAVECLHHAAREASRKQFIANQQREVIYTATILLGCKSLLQPGTSKCTRDDILFTIARKALHQLDSSAPNQARLLRLCMGWGNEEEAQADVFHELRQVILRCLTSALKKSDSADQ